MIIPINLSNTSSTSSGPLPPQLAQFGTDEIVLIEMQGTLESEGDKTGQLVGKLSIDSKTKKSTLRIGHHLLEGKLVNLGKPLAILHRPPIPSKENGEEGEEEEEEADSQRAEERRAERGWDIVAVVKRKMVFSKRPMPMVENITVPPGGTVVKKAAESV